MGYNADQIERFAKRLAALPPRTEARPKDVIRLLKKQIREAQKNGYTLDQIATVLREEGLEITPETFKSYLHQQARQNGAQETTRRKKSALPSPSPKRAETAPRGSFVPPREIPLEEL